MFLTYLRLLLKSHLHILQLYIICIIIIIIIIILIIIIIIIMFMGTRITDDVEMMKMIRTYGMICMLLQYQGAPEIEIDKFRGNPLEYQYFKPVFNQVVKKKQSVLQPRKMGEGGIKFSNLGRIIFFKFLMGGEEQMGGEKQKQYHV